MYIAIEHLTDSQIEDLYQLYQKQWWTHQRQRRDIPRMLQHSDEIVAFCEPQNNQLVAFSRLLTDYVYRAYIFDVIVAEAHQKQGLGRKLIEAILQHPRLQAVEVFSLTCLPEMVKFYQKWGFTNSSGQVCLMRSQNHDE
ncbi:MAG: GNAT family N-acetyltransferase [Kamptonema sp. SIO4C4]|nr:GNAT family N-acetyltransferase [Kamptonema sp. SIO4C4]